jgi:hypothetical protein
MSFHSISALLRPFTHIFIIFLIIILMISSFGNLSTLTLGTTESSNDDANTVEQNLINNGQASRTTRKSYTYHNYSTMVSGLEELDSLYSNLIELYTAQEEFGLPDCQDGYKIWFVRITNESTGFNKPEVLFLGGHHGNEPISIEAPYYLIEFLLKNYATNAHIRYLLDHREVYIMPVINPWGWENNRREDSNDEDMNRDYPYGAEPGNPPLTTVGARAVAELINQHAFSLSLSWHSGNHMIYYAWGTPVHDTMTDESPDNIAYFEVAKLMSNYAGGSIQYPYGPANQMFSYGAYGAWSDYAYAAGWDLENLKTGFTAEAARSLAFGIEISNIKKPDASQLGNSDEVFGSNDVVTGYIPQNIRMALVLIDLAEPYLSWRQAENNTIPTHALAGSEINLSWYVNGSFRITDTRLLYGNDPNPKDHYKYNSQNQSGASHWTGQYFTEKIKLPQVPGDYYFVATAQVDQNALIQNMPEPELEPQSLFVQQRTVDEWTFEINNDTISGSKNWYSSIIHIKVLSEAQNQIWISDFDTEAYCNEQFNISWILETNGTLNYTQLFWGQDPDPINHSVHKTTIQSGLKAEYKEGIIIPEKPGLYYFIALMRIDFGEIGSDSATFWSQIISIEAVPRIPYNLDVSIPNIQYVNGFIQTIALRNITCKNPILGDGSLDDTSMIRFRVTFLRFDPVQKLYLTDCECDKVEYDLEWSDINRSWFFPEQNISNWPAGYYQVICKFTHYYAKGESNSEFDLKLKNWFKVDHLVIVDRPEIELQKNQSKITYLDILNVTAWCSKEPIGWIEPGETNESRFYIRSDGRSEPFTVGNLTWSKSKGSWQALDVDISQLPPGNYFVECEFNLTDIGEGSSLDMDKEKPEFLIPEPKDSNGASANGDPELFAFIGILSLVIILLIIVIFVAILIFGKKKK